LWRPTHHGGLLFLSAMQLGVDGGLPTSGRIRADVELMRLEAGEESPRSLGTFPGSESELRVASSGGDITAIEIMNFPWMARLLTARGERRAVDRRRGVAAM
jgi:hypothetical protein